MISIEHDKPLDKLNSFGFRQTAERFVAVRNDEELHEVARLSLQHGWPLFILGGGTNIVLTRNVPGLTVHPVSNKIHYAEDGNTFSTMVTADAGVSWHHLVLDTLQNGLRGLENLSLIPGTVGAAPVQNIGAYGVELKDRLVSVRAFHLPSLTWQEFSNESCQFSYRHSFFKGKPGQYVITQATFELGETRPLVTGYDSLSTHLTERGIPEPTAIDISQSVIDVRQSRLPLPSVVGNAGSFFHNPVIPSKQARELSIRFPSMAQYPVDDSSTKLSAAWMIDYLGFKGSSRGAVGVYEKQALVLTHTSGGSGQELLALANEIRDAVNEIFGISLSIEPLII